jgi:serine/threonine-protein kinase HipA
LFEGLCGVFNDSLPDGWGRLLFDRFTRSNVMLISEITPLDRLTYIGTNALGALIFEPDQGINEKHLNVNLDILARQSKQVLNGGSDEVLKELLAFNGSSAGARPKALVAISNDLKKIIYGINEITDNYQPWIVKFSNNQDGYDAGEIEYVYGLMAKNAGILMPDIHLFESKNSPGYFAIKRLDRSNLQRFHTHTACGLLHSDFRLPSLDYQDLIALTTNLTKDMGEIEKLFRLAVFNVMSHNRDDHSKNFSFLMDKTGEWKVSPAYDLTFSFGPRGEQSNMVMGEGKNPTIDHLIKLGEDSKIPKEKVDNIIDKTRAALSQCKVLAENQGVFKQNIRLINQRINA